jgi:hypothetical protein
VGDRARALDLLFFEISAVTGAGVPALLEAAWRVLAESRAAETETPTVPHVSTT